MTQKLTIIFDLDGTLVDTAPDLMNAHNHVMKKYGYETKTTEDIRNLVGKGAKSLSVNGNNITEAIFDLSNLDTSWFRISIIDKFGGFAWLNPVWL